MRKTRERAKSGGRFAGCVEGLKLNKREAEVVERKSRDSKELLVEGGELRRRRNERRVNTSSFRCSLFLTFFSPP